MSRLSARRLGLKDGSVEALALINVAIAGSAFLKDVLFAMYLGTTVQADALTLAFFIPDAIGNNLLAMAIGVSGVAVLVQAGEKDLGRLKAGIRRIVLHFFLITVGLTLALYILSGPIINGLIGDGTPQTAALTRNLLYMLLPAVLLFPFIMIGTAALQAVGKFNRSTAAPVWFNTCFLCSILGAAAFNVELVQGTYVISAGIMAGILAMAVVVWTAVVRNELWDEPRVEHQEDVREDLKRMYRVFVPYMLILMSMQGVYFAERYFAATIGTGAVAGLNYAFRLAQFPIWVYAAAVGTILLPSLSRQLVSRQREVLRRTLREAFKKILLVALPTSILFYSLREPLVNVLFQRGTFDGQSARITSSILEGYSLTIVSQAIAAVCIRYFLAAGILLLPLASFVLAMAVTILLDYAWIGIYGIQSIGYAAAAGAALNAAVLLFMLGRREGIWYKSDGLTGLRIGAALVIPALMLMACSHWSIFPYSAAWWTRAGYVAIVVLLFGGLYMWGLKCFRLALMPKGS